jgi:hypothetical protein
LTSGGAGGQAIPTTADDVFFDGASGAVTCTIAAGNTGCKSMTCTGFTGTLTGTADLTIAGGFTFVAGMTSTLSGRFTITGSGTLTSAGKTVPSLLILGPGITVNQNDAFTFTSTPANNISAISLAQGTYNTNNNNITISYSGNAGGGIDVSNAFNIRAINLGSSNISITHTSNNNVPPFSNANSTLLTFNAGTSTITYTATSTASPVTFIGGGLTFNNVIFANASGSVMPVTGANTFANLTFTGRTTGGVSPYSFSANQTITGTFTVSAGTNATMRTFIVSDTVGTPRTLTCAAVSLTDADFSDITIAGVAAPASGTRLGDCKGNSGITFDAAKTVYWNLAGAQNWSAAGWALTSTGTPAVNNFPLAQDTATFTDAGSVTGTITINAAFNIGTIDMSARTSAMTLSVNSSLTMYGNWINGSGTTITSFQKIIFSGRNLQTITSAGKTFSPQFDILSLSGTVRLQDALTVVAGGGAFQINTGTLDLNGNTLTVAAGQFTIITANTKNITFNGGSIVLGTTGVAFNNNGNTGFTTTAGTGTGSISLTSASAKTFDGGFATFNCTLNQGGAGALTITRSNTFTNITNTYKSVGATTITFTAGTTQTFSNFNANGESGRVLTINSSSAGTQATLSKSSGTVSVDYLSIQDSNATGGATWNANNSTSVSNNTGWIFVASSSGNFFLLF